MMTTLLVAAVQASMFFERGENQKLQNLTLLRWKIRIYVDKKPTFLFRS